MVGGLMFYSGKEKLFDVSLMPPNRSDRWLGGGGMR
jgi:hypothetical protein